jgi:hypothetical protein
LNEKRLIQHSNNVLGLSVLFCGTQSAFWALRPEIAALKEATTEYGSAKKNLPVSGQ